MNKKERKEITDRAILIARAHANITVLRYAVKRPALIHERESLELDLKLAEIALSSLTANCDADEAPEPVKPCVELPEVANIHHDWGGIYYRKADVIRMLLDAGIKWEGK